MSDEDIPRIISFILVPIVCRVSVRSGEKNVVIYRQTYKQTDWRYSYLYMDGLCYLIETEHVIPLSWFNLGII